MRYPARLCTILVLSLVALTACKRHPQPMPGAMALAAPAGMRSMAMAAAPDAANRRIAFSESFVVELPAGAVEATQQKTLQTCIAAGCSVMNTRLDRLPDGSVQGSIRCGSRRTSTRRSPMRWCAPPARLVSHAETAEDKTIPLLDIEKRLNAQIALRDRLAEMLKQAGTSVGDLVAVEKQLADVQGTIESETAQRDYLRTITDTVQVDVSYNGLVQQAGRVDLSPVPGGRSTGSCRPRSARLATWSAGSPMRCRGCRWRRWAVGWSFGIGRRLVHAWNRRMVRAVDSSAGYAALLRREQTAYVQNDDEDRTLRAALMKADIANKNADTDLKQEQLRWEPWKALSAAFGAGLAVASGPDRGYGPGPDPLHPERPLSHVEHTPMPERASPA